MKKIFILIAIWLMTASSAFSAGFYGMWEYFDSDGRSHKLEIRDIGSNGGTLIDPTFGEIPIYVTIFDDLMAITFTIFDITAGCVLVNEDEMKCIGKGSLTFFQRVW